MRSRTALVSAIALCVSFTAGFAQAKDCCSEGECPMNKPAKKPAAKTQGYQVTLVQSGGFAGINKTFTIDSATVSKKAQLKIAELVRATNIQKDSGIKKTTPNAADMFFYEFTVADNGKKLTATFDDGTLPQAYRDLFEYMKTMQK
jgi:hypothetical protein